MRARLFARSLLLQSCWSYERMQGLGFAWCVEPWLRRCWRGSDGESREALARHAGFFNTEPHMAGFVLGVVCALEEEAARASLGQRREKIARVKALKDACAGALAGIGDALFWGALRPFAAALALAVGLSAWRLGLPGAALWMAGAYLAAFNAPSLWLRWRGIGLGYAWREDIPALLKRFRWQSWIRGLRLAGTGLALAAATLMLTAPSAGPRERLKGGLALAFSAAAYALFPRLSGWRLYGAACALSVLLAAGGRG